MTFPEPILLVTYDIAEHGIDKGLEGTLVEPVEAFNTDGLRDFYETVLIAWSTSDNPRSQDHATNKALIDWINTVVCPRIRPGRHPIWL